MARRTVPDILFLRAALVRLGGGTWAVVGQAVGRSGQTVEQWPYRFRERWDWAVEIVEPAVLLEAAGEAMLALRRLARSEDVKVRMNAAARLINYRVAMLRILRTGKVPGRTAADSEWVRLARSMEGQTDDQIEALLARRPAKCLVERHG